VASKKRALQNLFTPVLLVTPGLSSRATTRGPEQVKFTVKEKADQEKKGLTEDSPASPGLDPGAGVKFLVDVVDETGETVAIATILTMVRKLYQE